MGNTINFAIKIYCCLLNRQKLKQQIIILSMPPPIPLGHDVTVNSIRAQFVSYTSAQ